MLRGVNLQATRGAGEEEGGERMEKFATLKGVVAVEDEDVGDEAVVSTVVVVGKEGRDAGFKETGVKDLRSVLEMTVAISEGIMTASLELVVGMK